MKQKRELNCDVCLNRFMAFKPLYHLRCLYLTGAVFAMGETCFAC
jgi:hypothetical protein